MQQRLPPGLALSFTETMRGYWTPDVMLDDKRAYESGKAAARAIEFTLTIRTDDLQRFLAQREHECEATGTVTCPALDAQPLRVVSGRFNLFLTDPSHAGVRLMRYQLVLESSQGSTFFLDGTKTIRDDGTADLWADTTTLSIKLYEGESAAGKLLGLGVLHIYAADFAQQLTTVRVKNAPDSATEALAVAAFGRFFGGVLFDIYGTVAAPLAAFDPAAPARPKRALNAPVPEVHPVQALDGTALLLTRYRGGGKGPVMLVHGLGVSSRIFSTDTIDKNLVEFLCENGFDVWLLDFRASIELPASKNKFTGDDVATQDFQPAVDKIRALTGAATVQAIVHCFGATTFVMAMMAGLQGVRSAVISQIAAHVVAGQAGALKAGLHLPSVLSGLGVDTLNAAASKSDGALIQLLDEMLRLQEPRIGKRCTSATCHRISFMYAPLYEHAQLNHLTHECLHEMFGVSNVACFEHLALMVRRGKVVDADGNDAYMPHLERLAAIPVTLIHGEENECYLPESTSKTLSALQQLRPDVPRRRHVISGYGHIDCIFGKNAVNDVYPKILGHLETIGA